ncbi:MAG: class I SAM-dependent methyltransferase [Magnetococcales bacterium]|nr:class I SAM-dependent methyltransferase [Magnetococcales bacterium]
MEESIPSVFVPPIGGVEGQQLARRFGSVPGLLQPVEGYTLYCWAKEGPGTGIVVELGSARGYSTCWLAAANQAARRGKVFACDSFHYDENARVVPHEHVGVPLFQETIRRMGLNDWVEMRVGDSSEIGRSWSHPQPIRLLFIDADHSYEGTYLDFTAWFPHVEAGGVVAFHDIDTNPGCSQLYKCLLYFNKEIKEVASASSLRLVRKPFQDVTLFLPSSVEEAIGCYRQALERHPSDIEALTLLGTIYFEQQRLDEAERCYRSAMAVSSVSDDLYDKLAAVLGKQGKVAEAIDCYGHIANLSPQQNVNLAGFYFSQGQHAQAEACYMRVLTTAMSSPVVWSRLGFVVGLQGRIDEALACFKRAVVLQPATFSAPLDETVVYLNHLKNKFQIKVEVIDSILARPPVSS